MLDICLGIKTDGEPYYSTLEQARHLVICGYTGCGKTELTYKIIDQLADTQIYILNPLKIYYQEFLGDKNIVIAESPSDIKNCLIKIHEEIIRRTRNYSSKYQPIVIIADDYQSYNWICNFDTLPYLEQISYSEKVNIHLILATQYTKRPQLFKNILLNSSIVCMSADYRKLFLNRSTKHFSQNCNILAQIIGENELVELLPKQFPFSLKGG